MGGWVDCTASVDVVFSKEHFKENVPTENALLVKGVCTKK
jgi:hypothetical protein